MNTTYDIIIVGGGMVGAALACTLKNSPLQIALVDATTSSEDHRLIALNDNSYRIFKNLDIWPQLVNHASAIHEVHASYRKQFGATRLRASEMNIDALGYVVPAKFINLALYDSLFRQKNLTLLRPATLKNLTQHETSATLDIEINSEIKKVQGRVIVGADGTHSTVRKLLNIPTHVFDYDQSALVTTTELQRSHYHIAYERFHTTGAIAMLPLAENKVATIWSDSNENISKLQKLTDTDFLNTLQTQFGYRLGRLKKTGERFVYPLRMTQATQHIEQHVILIGNAAHTLHPIAAQGLNLALHEIAFLAEYFLQQTPATLSLKDLPADRTQENTSTRLSHYLPKLFTNDFFLLSLARQLGMISLDICQSAKKRFAKQAMGRAGCISSLAE